MIRQFRWRPLVISLLTLAVIAGACSDDHSDDGADPISLLDAGEEPRVELRLTIDGAVTETVVFTQIQEVIQLVDASPTPSVGQTG